MQDVEAKIARGYRSPHTRVYLDGREKLGGYDWKKRKGEVAKRSGGQCEYINSDGVRCPSRGHDAHHVVPRSKGRDDRLENLAHLCRFHHDLVDKRKVRWTPLWHRNPHSAA